MLIFKSKQKKFECDLKIKLCDKRLYPTESVKHLAVKIDTNLSWQQHINDLPINCIEQMLSFSKRENMLVIKYKILRSICFAIFDSYLYCCPLVSAQNRSTIRRIVILQKKAIRIINFRRIPRTVHCSNKTPS